MFNSYVLAEPDPQYHKHVAVPNHLGIGPSVLAMTIEYQNPDALRIWLPAIHTGSGTDIFVMRLAQALRRAGHEPLVQWFNHRYELMPELMRFHRKPEHIDIIHANSWNACVFCRQCVPVVATVHHLVHDPAYAPYRSIAQAFYHRWHVRWHEARAIEQSAAVTAVSSYVCQTVREVFGRESVQVINNWVDTDQYRPSSEYKLPDNRRFRLLMVGNHSRRKGYDLLPAFAHALGPSFDLRCTGGLRGNSATLGLENLSILGHLSEQELIYEYMHCDAVVSLSRYEGFGYTALEGMACGKPFVGFRAGGLTDVVIDGVTGFLVPINDLTALVERCMQLSNSSLMSERMGKAGRERALSAFIERAAIEAYIALYRKVIVQFQKPDR